MFDLECLLKIVGIGWHGYVRRGLHKFEFILCVGSTLNIVRPLYSTNIFTYFQVFRIVRLIRASPMLEDFVYKVVFIVQCNNCGYIVLLIGVVPEQRAWSGKTTHSVLGYNSSENTDPFISKLVSVHHHLLLYILRGCRCSPYLHRGPLVVIKNYALDEIGVLNIRHWLDPFCHKMREASFSILAEVPKCAILPSSEI